MGLKNSPHTCVPPSSNGLRQPWRPRRQHSIAIRGQSYQPSFTTTPVSRSQQQWQFTASYKELKGRRDPRYLLGTSRQGARLLYLQKVPSKLTIKAIRSYKYVFLKLVETCWSMLKLVQVGMELYRLDKTCLHWSKLITVGLWSKSCIKPFSNFSKLV